MAIKMHQGLRQSQSLMITPQLQQAIKLLTLTHLEMTTLISQEMVENPMLEEIEGEVEDTSSREEIDCRHTVERLRRRAGRRQAVGSGE